MQLFWLLVGHAIADFALQSDVMAKGKNPANKSVPPLGMKYIPCWPYWLTAHALIHGGMVALITGSVGFGIAETIAHWCIDFCKCHRYFNVHTDQILHVLYKILWWIL